MTPEAFKKLNDAFFTMLHGGPSDPPDHTYWAGVELIDFVRMMGVEETPEQKQMLDATRLFCETEGEEGVLFDDVPDEDDEDNEDDEELGKNGRNWP